jgi:hypothetical protein
LLTTCKHQHTPAMHMRPCFWSVSKQAVSWIECRGWAPVINGCGWMDNCWQRLQRVRSWHHEPQACRCSGGRGTVLGPALATYLRFAVWLLVASWRPYLAPCTAGPCLNYLYLPGPPPHRCSGGGAVGGVCEQALPHGGAGAAAALAGHGLQCGAAARAVRPQLRGAAGEGVPVSTCSWGDWREAAAAASVG